MFSRFLVWLDKLLGIGRKAAGIGTKTECLVETLRNSVGLAYGNPLFEDIVSPYWTRGYGTTCAVVLGWALQRCGWPGPLNRGQGWKIGAHMAPILAYATERDAIDYAPSIESLKPGDIVYLEGVNANDWHVGIVEKNEYPHAIVTLDGGQSDARGEQSIGRVRRTITGHKLGPNPRTVKLVVRTSKILG